MNLNKLQTEFQEILLSGQCSGADWIADSKITLSPQQRMGIYHNAYRVRLVEVLLDNFEHTAMYLGEKWFYKLANTYVQNTPSTCHNISDYGRTLPEYLSAQLPEDQEICELAVMDWRLRRAFDGEDCHILDNDGLQNLVETDGANTRLTPVPTASVVTHSFNTLDIWQAINDDQGPPAVDRLETPVDILIWRKGHSPHFRSLTRMESVAINSLLAGNTLEQIGESLQLEKPEADVSTEFGLMLKRWIDDRVLAAAGTPGQVSIL